MKLRNYLSSEHYLVIDVNSENANKIENLIKGKQKLFENIDSNIKINYFRTEQVNAEKKSKFYLEIIYYEYVSIIFYLFFSGVIFANFTMIGAIFMFCILLLLRLSFLELVRKIISSIIINFVSEKMKNEKVEDYEVYRIKKLKKEIIKHFN